MCECSLQLLSYLHGAWKLTVWVLTPATICPKQGSNKAAAAVTALSHFSGLSKLTQGQAI